MESQSWWHEAGWHGWHSTDSTEEWHDTKFLSQQLEHARQEIEELRRQLSLCPERLRAVRVASPLTDVEFVEQEPDSEETSSRTWKSWCPCCKRPLDITSFSAAGDDGTSMCEKGSKTEEVLPSPGKFAYVAAIWGEGSGLALGALVLASALRRTGTTHDLVLLHTDDVSSSSLSLLSELWQLRRVEYVDADEGLFQGGKAGSRFCGVFTKLHALALVEYEKVLMMDIDLVVFDNIDDLFNLRAPAAMWRGKCQDLRYHGHAIDGRCFFGGPDDDWGQMGGINAGVMLFAPDAKLHERALQEVTSSLHPERIAGPGPEQDYLSRFFASTWTHLSVLYNFQLHHVFFSLEAALQNLTENEVHNESGDCDEVAAEPSTAHWAPTRLKLNLSDIRIVHFSGEYKFWDRDYLAEESDEVFVKRFLRINQPYLASLWLDRTACDADYAPFGVRLQDGCFKQVAESLFTAQVDAEIEYMVDMAVSQVEGATLRAASQWRQDLQALPASLLTELLATLHVGCETLSSLKKMDRVEALFDGQWYPAEVAEVLEDREVCLWFSQESGWPGWARYSKEQLKCLRKAQSAEFPESSGHTMQLDGSRDDGVVEKSADGSGPK